MDEKLVLLRAKKAGLFIHQAREKNAQTIDNCAFWLNMNREDFQAVENGDLSLSLPQLESLSYLLGTSFDYFIKGPSTKFGSEETFNREVNLQLLDLRNHIISTLLKQHRQEKGISLEDFSKSTLIPVDALQEYETGSAPIPFFDLEIMIEKLSLSLEEFFSAGGPFGHRTIQPVAAVSSPVENLPADILDFVTKPVNRPYLELAMRLSQMEAEKLRSIAASLLEITY
jgi:transcriptional regulator with XRE-family HTH domain